MKILFVFPSPLDETGNPVKANKLLVPYLILPVLDALTPRCHSVETIFEPVENIDFSKSYDLVGITALTVQAPRAYQIADKFREKKSKVIIGGMHASAMPKEAKLHADSVVIGEVDDIWEQILEDCESNNLKEIYKADDFPDLKNSIFPKWDNVNIKEYLKFGKAPMMPLFTSRGCPMGCKFCSVSQFFGKVYRTKPVSRVLEEIDHANADYFFFIDDNIGFKPDYARDLFKAVAKKNIKWNSQISTRVLKNPELLELAAKSGCFELYVGLESINPGSLNSINKGFNKIEEYEELINRMHSAGIPVNCTFIIGFDQDTPDQIEATLNFLKKNKVTRTWLFILTPFPGTKLFEELEEQGRMKHYDWSRYDTRKFVFEPKNFPEKHFVDEYNRFFKEFLSHKNIISKSWYTAMNIMKLKPQKRIPEFCNNLMYMYLSRSVAFSKINIWL